MKLLLPAALIGLGLVATVALSLWSRHTPALGLKSGRLLPCPASPNCVCSEDKAGPAAIDALVFDNGQVDRVMSWLEQAVAETGGAVVQRQDHYLRALYVTPLLRFHDDVEFRLDAGSGVLHVRSASRVGQSDLGANRKRVEAIREVFNRLRRS